MDLTPGDIGRIEARGHSGFYEIKEGSRTLLNVRGRCIFLDNVGKCRIYEIRPTGCRLYPLVMEMPGRIPMLDTECPFREMFTIDTDDVCELGRLVDEIGGE